MPDMLQHRARLESAMSLGHLADRLPSIIRRLAKYSLADTAAAIGGLLSRPENHGSTIRLEALCHLAAASCAGRERIPAANLRDWLNGSLLRDDVARAEDPAEDVFVSCVVSWAGTSRTFEGIWEGNDFWLQSCLAALDHPSLRPLLGLLFEPIRALLKISDAVAARSGAGRFAEGGGPPRARLNVTHAGLDEGAARVSFSLGDLAALGIDAAALGPFVFRPDRAAELLAQTMGHTGLERRPVVETEGQGLILALPTAVGAAVRRLVLEAAAGLGLAVEFRSALREDQLGRFGRASAYGWGFSLADRLIERRDLGAHEAFASFDIGSFAHLLLVHDDPAEVLRDGLQGVRMLPAAVRRRIGEGTDQLRAMPGYRRGLTVLVHGGIGRGFAMESLPDTPDWKLLVLHLHDFVLLSGAGGFSAIRARKLLARMDELRTAGFEFMEMSGFANVYAYCKERDFEIAPLEAEGGGVFIAPNFVAGLRSRLRVSRDHHAIRSPCGTRWVEVERRAQNVFFDDDAMLPVYVSLEHASRSKLYGCVETGSRTWWLTCQVSAAGRERRSLVFQAWDMALNWLGKAAAVLDSSFPALPGVVEIALELPDSGMPGGPGDIGKRFDGPDVAVTGDRIAVEYTRAYLDSFGHLENVGDRAMVGAFFEGAARRARQVLTATEMGALVDAVVPQGARFLHLVRARSAMEEVHASSDLPAPRLVQAEDAACSRFGLARLAGYAGPPGLLPKAEATRLLAGAVDALWRRIEGILRTLDRASVVLRAMTELEAVEKERANWGKTAAALIALHPDRAATLAAAGRRESARAEATTTYRAVVEMAVCASPPLGGTPCGAEDLDRLLAEVSTLIEVAYARDALHHGLTGDALLVHPSLTIDIGSVLSASLKGGYLEARAERAFVEAADAYGSAFADRLGEPGPGPDPAFVEACRAEFGTSPDGLGRLLTVSADMAVAAGQAVVCVPEGDLRRSICDGLGVDEAEATRILDSLSLEPRARWDEARPAKGAARDWYPWRYGRRLSLIRRPFVRLDPGRDGRVVVSPALLDRDLGHLAGAYLGGLPGEMFDTSEMRRWIGSAINRVGHAFNDEVRDAFAALGYEAQAEVKMSVLGGADTLGDIDVLAWRPATRTVCVAECKRLGPARTAGEIGERLAEYTRLAPAGRERTPIERHLDRIAFVRSNRAGLSDITKIAPGVMKLVSCLVTHELVPMQFSADAARLVDVVTDIDGVAGALVAASRRDRT